MTSFEHTKAINFENISISLCQLNIKYQVTITKIHEILLFYC